MTEVKPKPGFCVCHMCDPARLVPVKGVVAHLTEHHLNIADIRSVELVEGDA